MGTENKVVFVGKWSFKDRDTQHPVVVMADGRVVADPGAPAPGLFAYYFSVPATHPMRMYLAWAGAGPSGTKFLALAGDAQAGDRELLATASGVDAATLLALHFDISRGQTFSFYWTVPQHDPSAVRYLDRSDRGNPIGVSAATGETGTVRMIVEVVTPGQEDVAAGRKTWRKADLSHVDMTYCQLTGLTADLTEADLTGARFAGMDLREVKLHGANLTDADLSGTNLTKVDLTTPTKLVGANLSGALLNGANLTRADLRGADLTNANLAEADLTGADLTGAKLAGASLDQAKMASTNFSGTDLTTTKFSSPPGFDHQPDTRTILAGATVPALTLGTDWRQLDLSGTLILSEDGKPARITGLTAQGALLRKTVLDGFSFSAPTDFTSADLSGASLIKAEFPRAVFTSATMHKTVLRNARGTGSCFDGADLTAAVLNKAELTGSTFCSATMTGVIAVGVRVEGANFTQAHLSATKQLFELPPALAADLDAGAATAALEQAFAEHGHTLAADGASVVRKRETDWVIEAGPDTTYLVEAASGGLRVSAVGDTKLSAVFSYAYMPETVFTSAELYGVDFSYAQWYGDKARAEGANLERANFANASIMAPTVGGFSMKQAKLRGANFTGAVLVNTHFGKAELGPSIGNNVRTSLAGACLQGTNFTEAHLDGADLSNAAYAQQAGVPLFDLDLGVTQELDKSAKQKFFITDALATAFRTAHYPLFDLSRVEAHKDDEFAWTVRNGDPDRPPLLESGQQYSSFGVRKSLDGKKLTVHGADVWVARIKDGQRVPESMDCLSTVLTAAEMDGATICPNGQPRSAWPENGLAWEEMVTPLRPPKPPKCIGYANGFCDDKNTPNR